MSKLTLEYSNGESWDFCHACGLTYSYKLLDLISNRDMKSHIEDIRNLEIRDDDIYLATYPKSGNAHVRSPEQVLNKRIKIVHVMRNPKDIFVSYYHHMKIKSTGPFTNSFQDFLPHMLGDYGIYLSYPWIEYVKEWERFSNKHPEQIFNLFFEDLKEDPVREIKKINSFCDTGRSDDLIRRIAEACDFKNLQKADAEIKVHENVMNMNQRPNLFRKGEVGDWKNHFTVAQNEQMNEWLEENLTDTELKFRYTL